MRPDRGDLVLLPFPFSDLSDQKRRPAIVVSPDRLHRATNDRIVVAVTSNLQPGWPGEPLPLSSRDLSTGKLPRPSLILPSKLFTVHRSLVVKTLGRVKPAKMTSILETVAGLFATVET